MKEMWNQRYSEQAYAYGTEPNAFFQAQLDLLPAGLILLPAEGEGRNAVYAATRGWEVVACDYSDAGKTKAAQLARENGVTIRYEVCDFGEMVLEPDHFDCVGLCYAHFSADNRKSYYRKIIDALKPGGVIILEAFSKSQLGKSSGGPKDLDTLMSREELEEVFKDLTELKVWEEEVELSEGMYHIGTASVVRLTGRK